MLLNGVVPARCVATKKLSLGIISDAAEAKNDAPQTLSAARVVFPIDEKLTSQLVIASGQRSDKPLRSEKTRNRRPNRVESPNNIVNQRILVLHDRVTVQLLTLLK